ncbi:hypothetical protein Gotur_026221, partial [Gossypium turneri]
MPITSLFHYGCIPKIICFLGDFYSLPKAPISYYYPVLPSQPKSNLHPLPPTSNRSRLRAAVFRHIRLPVQTLTPTASRAPSQWSLLWLFSSHDDHLTKEEVIDRVLDVVKSFPKVDPSKVTPFSHIH